MSTLQYAGYVGISVYDAENTRCCTKCHQDFDIVRVHPRVCISSTSFQTELPAIRKAQHQTQVLRSGNIPNREGWMGDFVVEARTDSVLEPVFRTETGRWMKSLKNRHLLEFQVMYLTKLLKLRYRLHHIPPYPPKTCRLCNAADETFEHVFEDCTTAAARYQAWMDNDAKCVPRIKELEVWKGLLGSWIGNVGSYSIERLREAATKALQHRLAIWIELCKTKASIPGTPPLAPAPPHPSASSASSTPVTATPSGRVKPRCSQSTTSQGHLDTTLGTVEYSLAFNTCCGPSLHLSSTYRSC